MFDVVEGIWRYGGSLAQQWSAFLRHPKGPRLVFNVLGLVKLWGWLTHWSTGCLLAPAGLFIGECVAKVIIVSVLGVSGFMRMQVLIRTLASAGVYSSFPVFDL